MRPASITARTPTASTSNRSCTPWSARSCGRWASRCGVFRGTTTCSAATRPSCSSGWPGTRRRNGRRPAIHRGTACTGPDPASERTAQRSAGRGRYGRPRPPSQSGSAHDSQLAARVVEPLCAVLSRDDDVFDPHAEPARQVDAGLDREAHAGLDRAVLALDHVRRLVGRETDAVAGAVDESLAVAGIGDHTPGRAVDVLAGDADADRFDRGLLRAADDLVHLGLLRGRLAHVDGASHVRAVAILGAAEVEHDRVALLDDAIALL